MYTPFFQVQISAFKNIGGKIGKSIEYNQYVNGVYACDVQMLQRCRITRHSATFNVQVMQPSLISNAEANTDPSEALMFCDLFETISSDGFKLK